jgi:hypothetical protein
MSIRWLKNNIEVLAVLGLLLSAFMAVPPCFAGGAATIVVDKNQLAPKGSYIPDRRVQEVLKKIEERKAMAEKKALRQEEQQQKNKSPRP